MNNIGDEALRTNPILVELYLFLDNKGYEGVKVIGDVLRTNTILTELNSY